MKFCGFKENLASKFSLHTLINSSIQNLPRVNKGFYYFYSIQLTIY